MGGCKPAAARSQDCVFVGIFHNIPAQMRSGCKKCCNPSLYFTYFRAEEPWTF